MFPNFKTDFVDHQITQYILYTVSDLSLKHREDMLSQHTMTMLLVLLFLQDVRVQGCDFSLHANRLSFPRLSLPFHEPSLVKSKSEINIFQRSTMNIKSNLLRSKKQLIVPLAGAMAASIAELLTYPLDVVKINMQVSRRGEAAGEAGIVDLLSTLFAVNGFIGMWRGFSAALLRQMAYQVFKVVLFEPLSGLAALLSGAGAPGVTHMLLGGGGAGALGAFLSTPLDRVKVRAQIMGGAASGSPREGLRQIYRAARRGDLPALSALYAGAGASCQRAFLVNGVELTTYKLVKSVLIRQNSSLLRVNNTVDNAYTQVLSALCSGLLAAAISAPIDRAKTLILASPGVYGGLLDCLSDVFVSQGAVGLFRGFLATWLRLAPFTVIFFLAFEYLKAIL